MTGRTFATGAVSCWSCEEVAYWLEGQGLSSVVGAFRSNGGECGGRRCCGALWLGS